MRKLASVALLAAITGCATPEQIAERRAQQQAAQEELSRRYTEALRRQCDSAGFSRGTDGHANCVLQLHNQNRANQGQLDAVILQQQLQNRPYCYTIASPALRGQMAARGSCQ